MFNLFAFTFLLDSTDGVCRSPDEVPTNVSVGERPGPAEDVILEEFTKHFGVDVTGNSNTAGDYTCLRIRYKLEVHCKLFNSNLCLKFCSYFICF